MLKDLTLFQNSQLTTIRVSEDNNIICSTNNAVNFEFNSSSRAIKIYERYSQLNIVNSFTKGSLIVFEYSDGSGAFYNRSENRKIIDTL